MSIIDKVVGEYNFEWIFEACFWYGAVWTEWIEWATQRSEGKTLKVHEWSSTAGLG